MSEEKDDFLREIDELLGDVDDDLTLPDHSLENGSVQTKELGEFDLESENSLNTLSIENNHLQPTPKTG